MNRRTLFFAIVLAIAFSGILQAQNVNLVGSYQWTMAIDAKVVGNYAYCVFDFGLVILNISNPSAPALAGQFALQGVGRGLDISGNYAFIADGYSGLRENPLALASRRVMERA